jgi:hypothetical protein
MQSGSTKIRARLPGYLLLFGIALQAGLYIALWLAYITFPNSLNRADFASFYASGRIANTAGFSHIYDLDLQHSIQQAVLGRPMSMNDMLPFNHPPLLLPIQALIASANYTVSYIYWELALVSLLGLGIYYSYRYIKVSAPAYRAIPLMLVMEFLFYPIFISILKGQDSTFMLLGAMIWMYGLGINNDRAAGLGLALTVVRPQIALFLAIPFLFNRRKVFWWFLAGSVALTAYSVWMVNFQGAAQLLQAITISVEGGGYGMSEATMFNLTGLLVRAWSAPGSNAIHAVGWAAYLAGVIGLSLLWAKSRQIDPRHLGLAVVLGLFTSPHLHYHDLGLLILPVIGIAISMIQSNTWQGIQPAWFIGGISILMLVFDNLAVRYLFVYLLMVLLIVFLWFPQILKRASTAHP